MKTENTQGPNAQGAEGQAVEKSNSLIFRTSKTVGKEIIYVTIRLNDECKNGHQDFAITGDIYRAGRPKNDSNHIAGGCIHEEIEKHFPEFKQFIKLHLCDYSGAPMHAGANGFYFLKNGFNNTPTTSPQFKKEFCEYYRVTPKQFDVLATSQNVVQFSLNLMQLGVLEQWQDEANQAIKELERLTGKIFVNDSVKGQFIRPTVEQREEEERRQNEGYYTPEAVREREQAKISAKIKEMRKDVAKKIKEMREDLFLAEQLYVLGGDRFRFGTIYYKHSNKVKFNWSNIGKPLTAEEIALIKKTVTLPKGATYETD